MVAYSLDTPNMGGSAKGVPVPGPRELGVLERLDGIEQGLRALGARLLAFEDRLSGCSKVAGCEGESPNAAGGLSDRLTRIEDLVRAEILSVERINGQF